ncbi:MAG: UDP-N-acetylmuramoyl-L-alanine--D-glutamate ligase [Acidobacteria bacterium]|nr:UDP-N-acetylmuramoyl-L-alanine--D-glutamate ligase [Acidobacteriota bacterium]
MKLSDLSAKSILILGLGREGRSSWEYLRAAFPEKTLGLADQLPREKLSKEIVERIAQDPHLRLHLGEDYLSSLPEYEVIVKSPGIPVVLPAYREAVRAGRRITSHTALFFANFPGTVVGVTGTKGKSTTAALLHSMLDRFIPGVWLAGNIGIPALDLLPKTTSKNVCVYELSSHQLEGLRQSPHIAVLLNIVPEHLDYYESFEQYVAAKQNITRYQTADDLLVYDADYSLPSEIASRSQAQTVACSLEKPPSKGCFLSGEWIVYRSAAGEQKVAATGDVPLLGKFNLRNVLAAVAASMLAGVPAGEIAQAIREFRPLEHRLERVGAYNGVTYYNDAIATVPEATIAALDALDGMDALGGDVETVLLGGTDRHLDFSQLAKRLIESAVKTLILFPPTGERIWQALCEQGPAQSSRPQHFFVESMEQAVTLAKRHTAQGKICLHSPASPSVGLFRDFRERGEMFKRLVREP